MRLINEMLKFCLIFVFHDLWLLQPVLSRVIYQKQKFWFPVVIRYPQYWTFYSCKITHGLQINTTNKHVRNEYFNMRHVNKNITEHWSVPWLNYNVKCFCFICNYEYVNTIFTLLTTTHNSNCVERFEENDSYYK